jgi:hypothetical protein
LQCHAPPGLRERAPGMLGIVSTCAPVAVGGSAMGDGTDAPVHPEAMHVDVADATWLRVNEPEPPQPRNHPATRALDAEGFMHLAASMLRPLAPAPVSSFSAAALAHLHRDALAALRGTILLTRAGALTAPLQFPAAALGQPSWGAGDVEDSTAALTAPIVQTVASGVMDAAEAVRVLQRALHFAVAPPSTALSPIALPHRVWLVRLATTYAALLVQLVRESDGEDRWCLAPALLRTVDMPPGHDEWHVLGTLCEAEEGMACDADPTSTQLELYGLLHLAAYGLDATPWLPAGLAALRQLALSPPPSARAHLPRLSHAAAWNAAAVLQQAERWACDENVLGAAPCAQARQLLAHALLTLAHLMRRHAPLLGVCVGGESHDCAPAYRVLADAGRAAAKRIGDEPSFSQPWDAWRAVADALAAGASDSPWPIDDAPLVATALTAHEPAAAGVERRAALLRSKLAELAAAVAQRADEPVPPDILRRLAAVATAAAARPADVLAAGATGPLHPSDEGGESTADTDSAAAHEPPAECPHDPCSWPAERQAAELDAINSRWHAPTEARLRFERLHDSPAITVVHGVASRDEALHLILLACPRLARSMVARNPVEGGGAGTSRVRTSATAFLSRHTSPIMRTVEERAAMAAGLPATHFESLQVGGAELCVRALRLHAAPHPPPPPTCAGGALSGRAAV